MSTTAPAPIIRWWHPFHGTEPCDLGPAEPDDGVCQHGRLYAESGTNGWPFTYPLPR